jgi:ABC-type multidrug transport system ATPase subunit
MVMIELKDLTIRFGRTTVVHEVSFRLAAGESLALWGPNGAGKTTLIRALLGLQPFSGEIRVGGHDVAHQGRCARRLVGYVPQQLAFYDDMTALGYLRYLAGLRRVPQEEAGALLARVGLAEHAAKAVGALSGGMKQRLALAAALLGDPPVLVLDEPTANLDAAARADFLGLLAELRAAGKTLLLTSHRSDEVAALADRVLVLANGRPQLVCSGQELAAALRAESVLRLLVAEEEVEGALAVLVARGFQARRNGHGLLVEVGEAGRAAPVSALLHGGIEVLDLMMEERTWTPRS